MLKTLLEFFFFENKTLLELKVFLYCEILTYVHDFHRTYPSVITILAKNLFRVRRRNLKKTNNRKGKVKGQTSNKCISILLLYNLFKKKD